MRTRTLTRIAAYYNQQDDVLQPDPLLACSDEDLLARFGRGQTEAFGVLVRRYERELYGYLRRYLGDANLADDFTSDADTGLGDALDDADHGGSVREERHVGTNAHRHEGNSAFDYPVPSCLRASVPSIAHSSSRSLVELIESRGPGPLDLAEGEERRKRVRASVDGLPEFLRQVVILAYYQGLKYREIADILEIPVGTVKSRLHAALVKLHEVWSESASLRQA